MRLPTYAEHRKFCQVDGWEALRQKTGNHFRYIKHLPNGTILRTLISHGSGQYRNPDLFKTILRDQLRVNEAEFWQAVEHRSPPVRAWATPKKPGGVPKPYWLVKNLTTLAGIPLDEVATMSQTQAAETWNAWCARPDDRSPSAD